MARAIGCPRQPSQAGPPAARNRAACQHPSSRASPAAAPAATDAAASALSADALVAFAHALLRSRACATTWRATSPPCWSTATSSATRRTASRCSPPISRRSRRARWRRRASPTSSTRDPPRRPGTAAAARTVAHAARVRRGDGDGADARHRHRRHPPLAPHRVPRRVSQARDRPRLMALLYCSDPSVYSVAPFGGVSPVFTPNPFAAGIPTSAATRSCSTSRRATRPTA